MKKKCLIAGLPDAGKSTYLGALSYMLSNPAKDQKIVYNTTPDDMSYLNRLSRAWLSQKKVDRTVSNQVNDLSLSLKLTSENIVLDVELPDIAGENFESIVQRDSEVVLSWQNDADSMLYFINQFDNSPLSEAFGEEGVKDEGNSRLPTFSLQDISKDIKNIILIKELKNLFGWKKMAVGISSWDLYKDEFDSPGTLMRERSPFMYNFLNHNFPDSLIFGVSAQGGDYEGMNSEEMIERTKKGKRAYVCLDKKQVFDITLPLEFLIKE